MKILKNLVVVVCCIVLCGDVIFAAKRVPAAEEKDGSEEHVSQRSRRCGRPRRFYSAARQGMYCSRRCSLLARAGCLVPACMAPTIAQIEPAVPAAAMSGLVLPSPRAVVPASYDDLPQRGPASDVPLSNGVVLREEDEAAVETDTEAVAHDEDAIYCFDCSDMQARCSCLIDCFVCHDRHEKSVKCDLSVEAASVFGYNPNNAALPAVLSAVEPEIIDVLCLVCCRRKIDGECPKGHMVFRISTGYRDDRDDE